MRLPEELLDASKTLCKYEGFDPQTEFHLFWYYTLKKAYPELIDALTNLNKLDWIANLVEEMHKD